LIDKNSKKKLGIKNNKKIFVFFDQGKGLQDKIEKILYSLNTITEDFNVVIQSHPNSKGWSKKNYRKWSKKTIISKEKTEDLLRAGRYNFNLFFHSGRRSNFKS
jgi:hypothetical protein